MSELDSFLNYYASSFTNNYFSTSLCLEFSLSYSPLSDSAYQQHVPNLDGGDGHSEHIIFGTNLDLTKSSDSEGGGEGQGEGVVEPASGIVEDNIGHDDSQQAKL